ncbi:hypothetical protein [Lampropedia aestuarii]|uniref:hypothetical protein n=1 Tax=Lampropedia aestuarii TaxID=2562762 RepID=UPI002468BE06|nr:hypothetical protein [Lampropedia aestuarii]MDH5859193.1 hypothetical protein [Lampropedia aestuarii]
MNPSDILLFLTPNFSDLLQAAFFCIMSAMFLITVLWVHIGASPAAWEKKWNKAAAQSTNASQGIEQGGVSDLFNIVATRPEKLAEVMPGMLLIVGLLGTFIGLGLALDKASSILSAGGTGNAAAAAESMQNMLGMLKGLGTKFKTSTWGIAGFILLKVWAEVTQFEGKRLAWVIGKVKNETETRHAQQELEDEEKWKKTVQLGTAMTKNLVQSLQSGFAQVLAAGNLNHQHVLEHHKSLASEQSKFLAEQHKAAMAHSQTALGLLAKQQRESQQIQTQHALENKAHAKHANDTLLQHVQALIAQHAELANAANVHQTHLIQEQVKALNDGQTQLVQSTQSVLAFGNRQLLEQLQQLSTLASKTNEQQQDLHKTTEAQSEALLAQLQSSAENELAQLRRLTSKVEATTIASQETNGAMQAFTKDTQTVIHNMDKAAQRMAGGADGVGKAAVNLLGAVDQFKEQFTEVLQKVRTDLGSAIGQMSEQASSTLEMGSTRLSESTEEISKALAQLSKDVTGTMNDVRTSIEDALGIQRNASAQIILTSEGFQEGMINITDEIGKLSAPISEGLRAISQSNRQVKNAVMESTSAIATTGEIQQRIDELIKKVAYFGEIPSSNARIESSLQPLQNIQLSLADIQNKLEAHSKNQATAIASLASATASSISAELKPSFEDLTTQHLDLTKAISASALTYVQVKRQDETNQLVIPD